MAYKYQTDSERLTEQIRQSMREHKLSVTDLAKKTKIPRTTVYRYFRNPKKAVFGHLMKMAYYAGIRQITVQTGGFIV